MFDPNGEPLTYVISGKRAEGEFNLDRKSPSNGIVCTYSFKNMPQEQKDTEAPVTGASSCDGKSQVWMATKMRDPYQSGN